MNSRLVGSIVLTMPILFWGCSESIDGSGSTIVRISVPDMMCEEGCAATVKGILSKQPGAKDVVVDFDAKLATVAVEEGTFDAQQALAALIDKGFDHSKLAAEGAAGQHVEAQGLAVEKPLAAEPPVR